METTPAEQVKKDATTRQPHPCGVCGKIHAKLHCPSCGAHPWEGFNAAMPYPSDDERPTCC